MAHFDLKLKMIHNKNDPRFLLCVATISKKSFLISGDTEELPDSFYSYKFHFLYISILFSLQFITLEKVEHSYTNTCAFDSVTQTLIMAMIDHSDTESLFKHIQLMNPSLNFVMHVKQKGTQHCYREHELILNNIIPVIDKR